MFAQDELAETEKLVTLGKMYGFLKYYHPEVGEGVSLQTMFTSLV